MYSVLRDQRGGSTCDSQLVGLVDEEVTEAFVHK